MSTDHPSEVWKDVKGFEGLYQVSDHGRVKSLTRTIMRHDTIRNRIMPLVIKERIKQTKPDSNGYRMVGLSGNGKFKRISVHRLVLEAFVGPCPGGMECRHLDGNQLNNNATNLCWGTKEEQERDKANHGRILRGSDVTGSRLTEDKVRNIRRVYKPNSYGLVTRLARQNDVSVVTIHNIVKRKTWRHLD